MSSDNPIQRSEDDALNRTSSAISFARQVLALDASHGVVVGVLGPWGSGKTSFVNLARHEFERADVQILDFNPWMFSGTEKLVELFFVELAAQLKLRREFAEIGKHLEEFGETFAGVTWLPLVGPWLDRLRLVTKIFKWASHTRRKGIAEQRVRLEKALRDIEKPILVVLDDIDRLSTDEIRDIFKLVRLTASFPNIIYILAFDRGRVEQALGEQGIPGRDYLEKILQIAVDLPAIPNEALTTQIATALDHALADIDRPGKFDDDAWPDVFMEIIRPLVRNMRDVRRFANTIHGTVQSLNGEVSLVDVLALEAIRVFIPDVSARLHGATSALTRTDRNYMGRDDSVAKSQIDELLNAAGDHEAVIRALINRVFPAAQRHIGGSVYGADGERRWLRERRVSHEEVLRLYLERVAGEGFQAFTAAEQAFMHIKDRQEFDQYLRELDTQQLRSVVESLEIYEKEFRAEHVVPATIVLQNIMPLLPQDRSGIFDLGPEISVSRVTYRLLRSLESQTAVEEAVKKILPELETLSSRLAVLDIVGYRENAGHKLVSEEAAAEFQKKWRSEVRDTSVDDLCREWQLIRVLWTAKQDADASEPPLKIDVTLHPSATAGPGRGGRWPSISR